MATTKQYALQCWGVYRTVSSKLGADIRTLELPLRVIVASTCIIVGTVLRIIFVKGLATDAEMSAAFSQIQSADIPPLPTAPARINETNADDPMTPDLGA